MGGAGVGVVKGSGRAAFGEKRAQTGVDYFAREAQTFLSEGTPVPDATIRVEMPPMHAPCTPAHSRTHALLPSHCLQETATEPSSISCLCWKHEEIRAAELERRQSQVMVQPHSKERGIEVWKTDTRSDCS